MSLCARCGSEFSCGIVDTASKEACWCTQLPTLPVDALDKSGAGRCVCRACLLAWSDLLSAAPPADA
jgi:hypothetical protein